MKGKFVFICVIAMTLMNTSYAYQFNDSNDDCSGDDCPYCTTCQCTDLGAGRNYCMSLSKYCEAFGNIGAR